ncbi:DUF397 domain-containing protein [Kitasatospora sp. NBC_01266]|uniref:DUF397 domain-containing protein n=1 Tax=Kitasatospora sp. NBC_01266 TaxID=2903572 RepID=UPI002E3786B3|nr:DUF397 domain-containing protein [Kitasatospora sp. NBC_01266]
MGDRGRGSPAAESWRTRGHECSTAASSEPEWRKSSYSSGNGQCVEVACLSALVSMRDSKDVGGPALLVRADAWSAFVAVVKAGDFPAL